MRIEGVYKCRLGDVRLTYADTDGDGSIHPSSEIISEKNYYPFGMPMPNRNVQGDYRYGYQGGYSEKDSETGLNAFDLRMYDSRIGRWISPDPYGQYHSPYMAMDNRPVSSVDPSGGCINARGEDCVTYLNGGATDSQGNSWQLDGGTWDLMTPQLLGEVTLSTTVPFWNRTSTRLATGDAIGVKGNLSFGGILEGAISVDSSWIIRGDDASFWPYLSIGPSATVGTGGGVSESIGLSKKIFNGPTSQINAGDLAGYSGTVNVGLIAGVGISGSVDASINNNGSVTWIDTSVMLGLGAKASPVTVVDIQAGVSHVTFVYHIGPSNDGYFNNPLNNNTYYIPSPPPK